MPDKTLTLAIALTAMTTLTVFAERGHSVKRLDLRFAEKVEPRGETRRHLEMAYNRLCSPPLNDIDFVLSDVNFQFDRRFTNYSGDISGRMLGALNACDQVLGKETPFVKKLIAGFKKHQMPDGHFGVEQNLDESITQLRDMALLWGNGRLLLALAERIMTDPDPVVRQMAVGLGDYMISTRKYYGKEANFKGVGGIKASGFTTCYPSLIDGLAALGEATGERRFVDEARFIAKLSLLDSDFDGHHSHGWLTSYRGMLDIDRISNTREFQLPLARGRNTIMERYMVPTGAVTEYFDLHYDRDEGCSEADWLRVNLFTWRDTSETGALDVAEHLLRNHIHAVQFSNGGAGHWAFRTLLDGKTKIHYAGITKMGSDSYWCCSMHIAQVLADVARWGVVSEKGKVYVTWLAEVRATLKPDARSKPIVVTTDRKDAGRWTVTVQAKEQKQATIALRVPGSAPGIKVDGKLVRGRGSWADFTGEGGWASITRAWQGKTTLKVELPDEIRLEAPYEFLPKASKARCVVAGTDLYCLPDCAVCDGQVDEKALPKIVLAATEPTKGRIPVVIDAGKDKRQRAELVRLSDRPPGGAVWVFRVERVGGDAFKALAAKAKPQPDPGVPMELEFGAAGNYEVYLNGEQICKRGGHVECPQHEAYTKQVTNVLAIKVYSKEKRPAMIGQVRVGKRSYSTGDKGWTAVRVGHKVAAALLTDMGKGTDRAGRVVDLGPVGLKPYGHHPGEYHNTKVRWIWAEADGAPETGPWLFRLPFDVPEAEGK